MKSRIQYFMVLIISLFLVGCGKKGPVEPLEPSAYPRPYPQPFENDVPSQKEKVPESGCCCDGH